MFAWIFRRMLKSWGSTGESTIGALVCGTPALTPRVNGTVGMTVRVYGTTELREC